MSELIKKKSSEALVEAIAVLEIVVGYKLQTPEEYTDATEVLKLVKSKMKFWEQERIVSVKPLNDSVKEINSWFKPALNKLEECETRLKQMIGQYQLRQREEQQRLLAAAAEAAQAAREAHSVADPDPPCQVEAAALLERAQEAQAPRTAGVSVREVWAWELEQEAAVPAAYRSVDARKIDAAVKAGTREIPGVRIYKDARVIARV